MSSNNSQFAIRNSSAVRHDSKLPNDWSWVRLGDVCKSILGGGTPSTMNKSFWNGNIPWITSADILGIKSITPRKAITKKAIEESATNLLPKENLVVVTRVGLGKIAKNNFDMCFSQDSQGLVLNKKLIDVDYALYILSKAVQSFKSNSRGTTINGVTKKQLKELEIPLPPLHEQKKIVAKIEELFSELDNGIENLRKAKEQIKTYRQSVLAYAFSGKLTDESRMQNLERRMNGVNSAFYTFTRQGGQHSALPEGWKWVKLGEVISPSKERFEPKENKRQKFIGLEHIEKDSGKIIGYSNSDETVSTKTVYRKGDLLYGKLRPYLNKVAVPDYDGVCSTDILVFSKSDYHSNQFLKYRLLSKDFVSYAQSNISGVHHPRVSFSTLSNFMVLLPPLNEQSKIVSEIERRFSVADKLEQTIDESLEKAEQLKQSILKQAFNGELI